MFALALLIVGCAPETPARLDEPAALERAAATSAQAFGDAMDDAIPLTALSEIAAAPEAYADSVVRTSGQIAQVCQRAGCWMELRDGDDGPAVRVPMAGHAFFIPRDAAGRHATMQGRVVLRELSAEWRAHLESEGAVETASALAIVASAVVID